MYKRAGRIASGKTKILATGGCEIQKLKTEIQTENDKNYDCELMQ